MLETLMFYVIYGKVMEDKDEGVNLAGVHFGGMAKDHQEAESIARDCVNNVKGGTIIPKIFEVSGNYRLPSTMLSAEKKFRKLAQQMIMASDIISRSQGRRK